MTSALARIEAVTPQRGGKVGAHGFADDRRRLHRCEEYERIAGNSSSEKIIRKKAVFCNIRFPELPCWNYYLLVLLCSAFSPVADPFFPICDCKESLIPFQLLHKKSLKKSGFTIIVLLFYQFLGDFLLVGLYRNHIIPGLYRRNIDFGPVAFR